MISNETGANQGPKPDPRAPRPRPIRIEGDIAYVPLTKGYEAVIDASDAQMVACWAWHVAVPFGKPYAQRSAQADGQRSVISMHRLIAGAGEGEDVDHADADTLNNRRSNLRRCTRRQNMGNMKLLARNKLGVKGVCQDKWGKFVANISRQNRTVYLGRFDTVDEAKAAYDRAASAEFGEFARSA